MLTLVQGWSRGDESIGVMDGLLEAQRELLLSTGSMTLALETHTGKTVQVELRKTARIDLSCETGDYLGLSPTPDKEPRRKKTLEREVWLTAGGVRLIYARTLIPLECIDAGLLGLLEAESAEPIGRILASLKIPFSKSSLEVGTLRAVGPARDLGLDPDTLFTARRYILFNDAPTVGGGTDVSTKEGGKEGGLIRAAVFEIFNPALIGPVLQPPVPSPPPGPLKVTGL
jgi:chorismate-pyruvate lyase